MRIHCHAVVLHSEPIEESIHGSMTRQEQCNDRLSSGILLASILLTSLIRPSGCAMVSRRLRRRMSGETGARQDEPVDVLLHVVSSIAFDEISPG